MKRGSKQHQAGRMVTWALLACVAVAGCTHFHAARRAQMAEQQGDWDAAVVLYLEALSIDPSNISYRSALLRAKTSASQAHFQKAKQYQEAGVLDRALIELQQAVELDPTNQFAEVEMQKVRAQVDAATRLDRAPESLAERTERLRGSRAQPPTLDPRSPEPISLNFPQPTSVQAIYRALGKAFGFSVFFDANMRDSQLAIELQDVTAEQALETICRAAQHFYKVLDPRTIFIAVDNQQNRRAHEDLVIQTFFLSNSEVKDTVNLLRSLVDARKVAQMEQLNAIVVRDTADRVKVAESIIRSNDKAKAEVVIDVELMQLNTTKLRDLGIRLSDYQVTQSLDLGSADARLRISDLQYLNQNNWSLAIPSFIYTFIKQSGDAQLLAQPRLRISEGETGRLTIGDKVPIPVTTFNSSQTVGGNIVPITSFQYTDVGIKIELEPRVHHNREVTLKLKIEVSNLGESIEVQGNAQPTIGNRSIESVIRLKDGETNFLAGLIRTDETSGKVGVPGLSEIPLLGRLFSKVRNDKRRTDLILTLTPHIVRTPDVSDADLLPMWIGTEQSISFRGTNTRVDSDAQGPFDEPANDPEQLRQLIRQGIQQPPRGMLGGEPQAPQVQEDPEEEQQTNEPPAGIDLAPARPPSDIFFSPPQAEEPEEQFEDEEEPPAGLARSEAATSSYPYQLAATGSGSFDPGVPGEEPVRLRLLSSAPSALIGESFEIAVLVQAAVPVAHLPLALSFDPTRLEFERVDAGDFLGGPQATQVLADASEPGEVLLGASQLGATSGRSGTGVVARLRFRALAAGPTRIGFLLEKALGPDLVPIGPIAAEAVEVRVRPERIDDRPRGGRDGGQSPRP